MRTRYLFTSAISDPKEFVRRLSAREGALVTNDPLPYPPGPKLLINLDDEGRPRIRHHAPPMTIGSPVLQLQITQLQRGLQVECELHSRSTPFSAAERELKTELAPRGIDLDLDFEMVTAWLWRSIAWLWRSLVWNLWLDALLHRRSVARYGGRLVSFVKEVAEEDGILLAPKEAQGSADTFEAPRTRK